MPIGGAKNVAMVKFYLTLAQGQSKFVLVLAGYETIKYLLAESGK
jgi:hypothetical protein